MGELFLIIVAIVLATKGDYTFFWIIGGIIVVALIASLFGKGGRKTASRERLRARIDIPHYYDEEEHACSICGHRFYSNTMSCPHCGVRFNTRRTDERAFIVEEDEEEWWDEMEEEEGW